MTGRLTYLLTAGVMALALLSCTTTGRVPGDGMIMTVRGPIAPAAFGRALTHEHIIGAFVNLDQTGELSYSRDHAVATMQPLLEDLTARGFTGLVETTPVDLAREVTVLRRLSEATGLHIVTNTGNYGAANDSSLLSYGFTESADQLAARWIGESLDGIEGTGVRPGIIKTAVDHGPLSELDRKLVQAAARTHLQTGLTMNIHTGEAVAALAVLETIEAEGVAPSALVVVHAAGIEDQNVHYQLAEAGAWISYDNVKEEEIDQYVTRITAMIERGYGDQLLVSHDAFWYDLAAEDGGTTQRPYTVVADSLLPALERAGVTAAQIETLVVDNPARAFTVRVRAL